MKRFVALTFILTTWSYAHADVLVKSGGKKPTSSGLRYKTSKVPQYNLIEKDVVFKADGHKKVILKKVADIPKLDIGEEPTLNFNSGSTISLPAMPAASTIGFKKLQSPADIKVDKLLGKDIKTATAINLAPTKSEALPALPTLKEVAMAPLKQPDLQTKPTEKFKEAELRLFEAMIFLDYHKNYLVAIGLLKEILKDPEFKYDATYQLAQTINHFGIHSEYRAQMLKLLDVNKGPWSRLATENWVENLGYFDRFFINKLAQKVNKYNLKKSQLDYFNLLYAKQNIDEKDLTEVSEALDNINSKSEYYLEGQVLKSLLLYRSGQFDDGLKLAQKNIALVNSAPGDVRVMAALTLARLQFQKGQYKEAYQTYLKVEKNNSHWLEAISEQSWTQILAKDYEGAAGNMFSLHTEFFKYAFKPESYIVRTIAYLNLCQYGDALQVLKNMKNTYTPLQKKITEYRAKNKKNQAYYETVKSWLKNQDLKEVDGLPRRFIVELARHPSYLIQQKHINSLEDEVQKYGEISKELIQYERSLTAKLAEAQNKIYEIKAKIEKSKSDVDKKSLASALSYQEQRKHSYSIQQQFVRKSRNSLKDLRTEGLNRIEKEKVEILAKASQTLKNRYVSLEKELSNYMDQIDVLAYEIFSGAGEQIRYQMAGGETGNVDRAQLKAEADKSMKWFHKGEIWEDEVGHYRSSLKDNCPKEEKVSLAH